MIPTIATDRMDGVKRRIKASLLSHEYHLNDSVPWERIYIRQNIGRLLSYIVKNSGPRGLTPREHVKFDWSVADLSIYSV